MKFQQFNEGKKDKFPNIKKVDVDGFIVYVGRDALSNDHLTFNMAQPEDYWFHAKGVPGSHVLIRVREKLPTKEVIKKVAEIAAKNSKSEGDKTTIVYCQKKFVKKEKGMNPGQVRVDYINAEEVII
jgi:predicted ribosome quality control (RQC) complex YloA/Tae2 family protein